MANKKRSNKKKGGKKPSKDKEAHQPSHARQQQQQQQQQNVKEEEETRILSELRKATRSLLETVKGVVPDGSPFVCEGHPLANLHASVATLVERLIVLQRRKYVPFCRVDGDDVDHGDVDNDLGRDDPELWRNFQEWLLRCQIDLQSGDYPVEIRKVNNNDGDILDSDNIHRNSNYGLFATRDIDHDETVLQIPVPAMLCPYWPHILTDTTTCSMTNVNNIPPPPFDPHRPNEEDEPLGPLCLVTFLANERWKGNRSPYKPYLDTLPTQHSTPLYWSLETTRQLKRSHSHLKRAVTLQALTVWEYLQLKDVLERERNKTATTNHHHPTSYPDWLPPHCFTYELFRWATVTAHTRQNLIPFTNSNSTFTSTSNQDVRSAYALVPLWDLLNHEDSDRACRSEVLAVFNDNESNNEHNDCHDQPSNGQGSELHKQQQQNLLVCSTPPRPPSSNLSNESTTNCSNEPPKSIPCFRRGEEITMYYGERSNAQLMFHSGFVNGGKKKQMETHERVESLLQNDNRKDHVTIRLALPPADMDGGMDKIREMIAAKFGFVAYVDQGCNHDGNELSRIAAKFLNSNANANATSDNDSNTDANRASSTTSQRDKGCVVMLDMTVSPNHPCPNDLKRALLLCLANKDELAHLLRNMNRYLTVVDEEKQEIGNDNGDLLELDERHVQFLSSVVRFMNLQFDEWTKVDDEYSDGKDDVTENASIWASKREALSLLTDLIHCERITLNSWFDVFSSKFAINS